MVRMPALVRPSWACACAPWFSALPSCLCPCGWPAGPQPPSPAPSEGVQRWREAGGFGLSGRPCLRAIASSPSFPFFLAPPKSLCPPWVEESITGRLVKRFVVDPNNACRKPCRTPSRCTFLPQRAGWRSEGTSGGSRWACGDKWASSLQQKCAPRIFTLLLLGPLNCFMQWTAFLGFSHMHNAFSCSFFSLLLPIRIPKAEYLHLGLRVKGSCISSIGSLGAVTPQFCKGFPSPQNAFALLNTTSLSLPFGNVEKQRGRKRERWASEADFLF